ncbi:hypothetical protein P7K49_009875 [Saguinus oedipus]|uniref:SMB domain-containing protein n=1 Tax=Saguinus oedipus TaxID=9490 RepID=A0ABQ9VL69_SAGOE|nr:hypothetical protein P7K49_009875 [Saguinus oedipus]
MGLRGVEQILSLWLALAAPGRPGLLHPWQGCAALGRCCPGRDPLYVACVSPRCFCEQVCGAARDCCSDYPRGKALEERSERRGAGEGDAWRKGFQHLGAHEHGWEAWGLEGGVLEAKRKDCAQDLKDDRKVGDSAQRVEGKWTQEAQAGRRHQARGRKGRTR